MSLLHLLKKGGLRSLATAIPATFATDAYRTHQQVAKIATVAVASAEIVETYDPYGDTDRHCWPHSTAMNRAEIIDFTARILRFKGKGISADDAEKLADRLVRYVPLIAAPKLIQAEWSQTIVVVWLAVESFPPQPA